MVHGLFRLNLSDLLLENKLKDLQDQLAKLKSKAGYQESDLVNYARKAATFSKKIDHELEAKNEQSYEDDGHEEDEMYNRSADHLKEDELSRVKSYGTRGDDEDQLEGTISK